MEDIKESCLMSSKTTSFIASFFAIVALGFGCVYVYKSQMSFGSSWWGYLGIVLPLLLLAFVTGFCRGWNQDAPKLQSLLIMLSSLVGMTMLLMWSDFNAPVSTSESSIFTPNTFFNGAVILVLLATAFGCLGIRCTDFIPDMSYSD